MNNDPWANFLNWEQASRDTIDFKTIYVDMADDLITGLLLSQIVYWYLPSKKGQSKLRVFKDGFYWIAKARHEWWDEIRIKTRQIDRAITKLEEKGIIVSRLFRFNNAPTTHIRIIKEGFLAAWDNALARFDETVKSELPSDPFSPNLQFDLTDSSSGFDETVKSDLPESVQSITETTIDSSETTAENTGDFPEKTKAADPLLFDLERQTLENNEGNYATPARAGGDDLAAEAALATLYTARGSEPPLPDSNTYKLELEKVSQVLSDNGVTDPDISRLAAQMMCKANEKSPKFVNPHYRSFPSSFTYHLGVANKRVAGDDDRRARDVEITEDSLAVLAERRAARPPPPQDDEVGTMIKTALGAQMGRNEFQRYVRSTRFTCDNGALVVAAPDEEARNWLEGNLGQIVKRALAGVAGGPGEIRFEVAE